MMWGARFKENIDKEFYHYSNSLKTDLNFFEEEIKSNLAYAKALERAEVINKKELKILTEALEYIKENYSKKQWAEAEESLEDIHSSVERKLYELVGDIAGKLHSGRSRNDLVVTDIRLWIKRKGKELISNIRSLQSSVYSLANEHFDTLMPGYTHLQRAQPISLAYHLYSYLEATERDIKRINDAVKLSDNCPLGSSAIAGTTINLDRKLIAEELGFSGATEHALDTISDRDFILDFLHVLNNLSLHISRISEDLILWASHEWNFLILADHISTGSSLMPQKKNPDLSELLRGKSGKSIGAYVSLSTITKGLYTGYHRDLQDDKKDLIDLVDISLRSLNLLEKLFKSASFNVRRFEGELDYDFMLSTHLAEYLVMKGVPFRESHELLGKIISDFEAKGLNKLDFEGLKKYSDLFDDDFASLLLAKNALAGRKTYGACSFTEMERLKRKWGKIFK